MPTWLEGRERGVVVVLCIVGALRILLFSAAFPPLHSTDEPFHFDLVVKYAHRHVPHRLADERLSAETRETIVLYGTGISRPRADLVLLHNSPEYLTPPSGEGMPPPVWTAPAALRQAVLPWGMERWNLVNHEATEPPVYYAVAGAWYRLGQTVGLAGGQLFYWTRFLNGVLFAGVVALAYLLARTVCPGHSALALAAAVLVAAFPQGSFYGATNDAPLVPLLFAAALVCLVHIARAPRPWPVYGLAGLLTAATVLTKYSNVAVVGALLITLAIATRSAAVRAARADPWRLTLLALAALGPVAAWFTRNDLLSGDPTGARQKYVLLGWSLKSPGAVLDHPFFGAAAPGALGGTFAHGVLTTLWRGELTWHGTPMALPGVDWFYSISSLVLLAFAVIRVWGARDPAERITIWTSAVTVGLAVATLAVLSTVFDFGTRTLQPSPRWPYFTSGRLIVGILVPFVTLYLYGLEWMLAKVRSRGALLPIVVGVAILVTAFQVSLAFPAWQSPYNWFHLPWRAATGAPVALTRSDGERRPRLPLTEARPHLGIHEHLGPLATQYPQHLARDLHRHLAVGLARDAGDVRRADDVLEVEQRVVPRRRLVLPHVEARGRQPAAREGLEERALVLHGTARGVDVDRARLHEGEGLLADHVLRLGRERRVAREDVDLRQELLQALHRLRTATPHLVVRHVLVVAEDAHADGPRELRHPAADVADADDPEGLARELRVADTLARIALGAPVPAARHPVDQERALDAREHQHERVLRHRLRVRARRVDHGHAESGGGGNVHRVEADPVPADDPEPPAGGHQARAAVRPDAEQDPLSLGRGLREPGLGLVFADDDARLLLEQRLAVGIDGTGQHDQRAGIGSHRVVSFFSVADDYFQAARTSRGASSEKGVPSSPP
jgi:hypothetical protein